MARATPAIKHNKMYNNFIKPLLDWLFAFMFILLVWPLFLLVAVLIKLESRGPVFFRQERLGKNGRVFRIYKFRTMVENAIEMGTGLRACVNDPRITKVGHILRKTSFDELPQLFNILRGEMSFIGPRPPVPYSPYQYEDYTETQQKRFLVKPGISGYAQIIFRNNAAWNDRIEYDVKYVEDISFLGDVRIVFLTILVVIANKNLYPNEECIKQLDQEKISRTQGES